MVAIVAALMMLIGFLTTLNPQKDPLDLGMSLVQVLFFGIFLTYGVPWIIRFCPSEIRFTDKMLVMLRGNQVRSEKWENIEFFTFGESYGSPVLRLKLRKGSDLELGLDSTVHLEGVGRFLHTAGVLPGNSEQTTAPNPSHAVSVSFMTIITFNPVSTLAPCLG